MWFGQTGLYLNRFETGLSASVNRALDYGIHNVLWSFELSDISKIQQIPNQKFRISYGESRKI